MRHDDGKSDYVEAIAEGKHIIVDKVRYLGNESNDLDEVSVFVLIQDSYLEYGNREDFM
ncbi:hypothetical protein Thermo_00695 [Thermoplasmatales archaeon]|nr:hypothetical protein Thermo_00695 [Thermoplasmatales archaeon]